MTNHDTTTTVTALVRLSEDFRATCMGFDPEAPYAAGFAIDIESTGDVDADLETVFDICNSSGPFTHQGVEYPAELHCPARYEEDVKAYRAAGNRSLSVGDLVQIGEATFSVERFGFKLAAGFKG